METKASIHSERIDDIPLLFFQQRVMGIPQIIDEKIEVHGNHQGLSLGWLVTGWLTYIVSESDHRLSYVEPWAEGRLQTLQALFPDPMEARDFSDDRLGDVLDYLSQDEPWQEIEKDLGQHQIQVYQLPTERVRADSTSAAVYHEPNQGTLIRYGVSKDHRPDLGQFKVMMSGLDPLHMPLATLVVPGNEADDGLYLPIIEQSRQVLGQKGVLYIGDSKMEALATRAGIVSAGDYYYMPLSMKGKQAELLHQLVDSVWHRKDSLPLVTTVDRKTERIKTVARVYETSRSQQDNAHAPTVTWEERVLVVYSPTLAKQAGNGLAGRLERAETKIHNLTPPPGRGRKQYESLVPLQSEVERILKQHRVQELLQVTYHRHEQRQHIRKYRDRPARTEVSVRYQVQVTRNQEKIRHAHRYLGWRLYVTAAPRELLSAADGVLAYRQSPTFEHGFSRFKNRPLGLRPLFLRKENRITGLVRLLSLALRVLTILEFVARRSLQEIQEPLTGLYPGNPNQATLRPTAERLLRAFDNLNLTFVHLPEQTIRQISPLSSLQSQILALLGLPTSIYSELDITLDHNPP